jgi:PAS domain S-box-containing protein
MKSFQISSVLQVLYVILLSGGLWLLTTDKVSTTLISDTRILSIIRSYRIWGIIIVLAIGLFFLIKTQINFKKASKDNYSDIFETAVEGIFQSTPEGRYLVVNPAMASLYGYASPQEMVDTVKYIGTLIYLNKESYQKFIALLNQQGSVERFEAQNLRKDGNIIWTSTNARVVRDGNGSILYYEGFVTDVTGRKNAEIALRNAEERYRVLVERLPAVVFMDVFDNPQTTQYMSPRLKDLLGYTPEEWVAGDNLWENSIHPEDKGRVLAEDIRTDQTGDPFRIEYRLRARDGHYVWIREEAYLIKGEDGTPLFWQGILLNITDQKQAQAALRRREAILEAVGFTAEQFLKSSSWEESIPNVLGYLGKTAQVSRVYVFKKHLSSENKILISQLFEWCDAGIEPQINNQNLQNMDFAEAGYSRWINLFDEGLPAYGTVRELPPEEQIEFQREGILSIICFPIQIRYDWWGFIGLDDCREEREWSAVEIEALRTVVSTLGAAIQRKISEEAIFSSEISYKELFNSVADAIYIQDAMGRFLDVNDGAVRMFGYPKEYFIGKTPKTLSAPGKNNLEKVFQAIQRTFEGENQQFEFWGLNSNGQTFPQDVRLYKGTYFGQDVVIAITQDITDRKRAEETLQRELKRLSVLHSITLAEASSRSMDELLQRVTNIIGDTLYSDNCGVLLLDQSGSVLQPHFSYRGTSHDVLTRKHPITQGVTGKVVMSRKPIRIGDVSKEAAYFEVTNGIQSELCVPISAGEVVFGVLNVESHQADAFTEDDERLLVTIAGGLATSIERLQLFDAQLYRRQQADTLREATAALTTSIEPQSIYRIILESLSKLVNYTSASIEIINGEYIEIVAYHGPAQKELLIGKKYRFRRGLWGVDQWQPIIIPDVQIEDRFHKFPETKYIHSRLGVPLISQDQLLGYLNLDHEIIGYYTNEHAALIQTFANQAAIALENARAFQEEKRRSKIIEALAEIANEIATTGEMEPVLDKVAIRTRDLLKASHVAIYLLQEDNQTIKIVNAQGTFSKELLSHTIKLGEGITGNIIAAGKPEIINDTTHDPRRVIVPGTPEEDGIIETMMSAPLILRGKAIGAINAWRLRSDGLFNESELNFLISIAHQTSISMEAGRLFQETLRRAQESAAIAEVGRDISATLKLDLVLERIAVYAKELLKAETSAVYLYEPENLLLRAIAVIGNDVEEIKNDPLQIGAGILGNIARSKTGEIVNDTTKDPRAIVIKGTEVDPYEHLMGVPVLKKEELTGLLVVWRTGLGLDFIQNDLDFLAGLAQQAAVAIENARLFQAEQKRRQEAENLRVAAAAITSTLEPQQVLNTILVALQQVIPYDSASILQLEGDHVRITGGKGLPHPELAINQRFPANNHLLLEIKKTNRPLILEDCTKDPRFENWANADYVRGWMGIPLIIRGEVIGYITLDSYTLGRFDENDAASAQIFAHQAAVAMDNAHLFTETRQRLEELEVVSRISFALRAAQDSDEMLPILMDEIKRSMDTDTMSIWLYNPENNLLIQKAASGQFRGLPKPDMKPSEGIVGHVFTTGEIHISGEFSQDPMVHSENVKSFGKGWGGLSVPIRTASETIGVLIVAIVAARQIESHHIRLLTTIAEIAGNAIHRSDLYERSEKQIRRLTTLREIDTAISSSFDLRVTLDILSEHLLTKMGVSAVAILTLNLDNQTLNYFSGAGFRYRDIFRKSLQASEGTAGRVLISKSDLYIENLNQQFGYKYPDIIAREGFVSYYAVPLHSKGLTRGVLETYFRSPFVPNPDWVDFLHALAGQATIAIDNSQLFENLQRSNQELSLAYDTTLEGWGKALELRDKETEGHTRRVTELTIDLARQLGIPESELAHIRRGVLLHDIGKMGVPDSILRKEGPLTDDEWIEMRKHPQYAYDLLYPIPYLRASLDIPYHHHEWWDGNGYPSGLKGKEIPLSARIFAVVDVWDALLSDRPYRRSWQKSKVFKYLHNLSGKQFDPEILKIFLNMMQSRDLASEKKPSKNKARKQKKPARITKTANKKERRL